MNNHQSLKAEIDAREENFSICLNLGRDLLDRKHYRSDEVSTFDCLLGNGNTWKIVVHQVDAMSTKASS